jgi:hypothetical protein
VKKNFQAMAILSFVSAGLMIVFSLLLGVMFRSQRVNFWYDSSFFLLEPLIIISAIFSLISMLASIALFTYIGIKLISGRRIKIEFIYLAVALSFVPEVLLTVLTLLFYGVFDAFWVFIEQLTGYSFYGISLAGWIVNIFAGLVSHAVAIVLLVLTIKNRYLLNTLPVGPTQAIASKVINKAQSLYRECPFCAETVLVKANLCKHCKSKI